MDLLIFDLDGTLIDSKLDLAHAVNATRGHLGMPPLEHERVYSYVGNGAPVLIRRVLGPDATEAQVEESLEFFLEYYRDHKLDYTVLYPGVRQALDRLRDARVQMAVLTNKPVGPAKAICDGLGLSPYFFSIYGGDSFPTKKPDPLGLHTLMTESGATPEETVMIGDSDVDMLTARNAGTWSMACTFGLAPESLEEVTPDAFADHASAWALALGGAEIEA